MAHPTLVPIFFADDPDVTQLTSFSQKIVASSWLTTVGAEYGVGAGSVLSVVHRIDPAPDVISDTQIIDLLFAGLGDGTIPRPTSGDVLYMIHFPSHTLVTAGSQSSCTDFGGYHSSARRAGVELAYAVIATCPGFITDQPDVSVREIVSSHELIEAATDPIPSNHPGFQLSDPTSPWIAFGTEVGDLCTRGDATGLTSEADFVAQRSWSNKAAGEGKDPCVPASATAPYFNVVATGKSVPRIPPGMDQAIPLRGWASGAAHGFSWDIAAVALMPGEVTLKLDKTTLTDGVTTVLDVAVPAATTLGTTIRFAVVSRTTEGYALLPMFAVAGNACSSFTGCENCTAHIGCGFCASSGKCEAESSSGSAESSCSASSFATWSGSCPGLCASHNASCTDCASQPGCGWCASGGATHCVEASHETGLPESGSCPYADWSFTPDYCSP